MTLDREELEELIRRVIAEERAEAMSHPLHREKFTRYTDPDGKTWVSATMERAEVAQKMIAFVLALIALLSSVNYAVLTYAVRPAIEVEIKREMAAHNEDARRRMDEMLPHIVNREEWVAWTAEKKQMWDRQQEVNELMEKRLTRIEEKLDRLIERGR